MHTDHTIQSVNKIQLADRVQKLPRYVFAEIADQKKKMDQSFLLDFSLGSPDTPTPDVILNTLTRSIHDHTNHGYPRFNGKENLISSICEYAEQRFGLTINEKNVLPLLGSKEGIAHLPLVYLNPGDVSLVPDPHYPVHYRGSIIAGAEVFALPLRKENGFLPDLSAIPVDVANKAKMIVISYPNNPTGAVATDDFMRELVAFCRKFGILLCHDLAYSELYFGENKVKSIFEYMSLDEPAVEFFTFSKTYHMAGWRIGFCFGNDKIVQSLYNLKTNMDYGISGAIQDAAAQALKMPQDFYAGVRDMYESRMRKFHSVFTQRLGWDVFEPGGGMYLWVPAPDGYNDGNDFAFDLLEKIGVVTTPGSAFGLEGRGFVRFALVQPEDKIEQAIDRIIDYFDNI